MKNLLVVLSILISSSVFAGGNGAIQGRVFDAETGEPVSLATIHVKYGGSIIGTTADFDGRFMLKPLESGFYELHISYTGYKPHVISGVAVSTNKTTRIDRIELGVAIHKMDEFVVVAERYSDKERLIKIEDPVVMTMLAAEIEKNPALRDVKTLISRSLPGIVQADEASPAYFKGAREDAVVYFIDGVKSSKQHVGIPSTAIGEINVYTGGVPAQYGDVTGGVVVIETKSYFGLLSKHQAEQNRKQREKEYEEMKKKYKIQ